MCDMVSGSALQRVGVPGYAPLAYIYGLRHAGALAAAGGRRQQRFSPGPLDAIISRMNTELVLLVLSAVILVSYSFDIFSSRTKVPSVLLLLVCGLGLKAASLWSGWEIPYISYVLAPLGTVGLILIVLEAGLDLNLTRHTLPVMRSALVSAVSSLLLCMSAIALFYWGLFGVSFRSALVNALPFAIVSSAIAIPGSRLLGRERSEFVTYESSFSDILGILLFNLLVFRDHFGFFTFVSFGAEILSTLVLSVLFSLALALLIAKISHPVKHLPVFAILLLVYAAAKAVHFSPLILVLVFGLFLNNITLVVRGNMRKYFELGKLQDEIRQFRSVIYEGTFVIKTFFFVLLGYSADLPRLLSGEALAVFLPVLLIAYASRALPLRLMLPAADAAALTYVAPRGLITILLFMGIPPQMRIVLLPGSVLLWVVLGTSLVMAWGVIKHAVPGGAAFLHPLPSTLPQK